MTTTDAIIVGAGPAGSVTALLLARAGWHVLLLDAREFPRAKPCGDCISPGANGLLRSLGVWDELLAAGAARLDAWRLASGPSAFAAGFSGDVSLALPRERLDAILLAAARRAGAEVRTGVPVHQLIQSGSRVSGVVATSLHRSARIVIGADGLRSRTARLLHAYKRRPRTRKLSLTAHLRAVHHVSGTGEMHVLADACLGIAPVTVDPDPLCNVTVVLKSGTQPGSGRHELMRTALRRFGRDDIAELISDREPIMASGPFDWPTRRVIFDGAALVGDAAGYFDPFTGQGIYQAIAGAHLLAEVVDAALHQRRVDTVHLAPYASAHRQLLAGSRRVQRLIDVVCTRPRLTARLFNGLAHTPRLAERLVEVTGDVRRARDLLAPSLLTKFAAASLTATIS